MNNLNLYLDNLVDQGYDITLMKYWYEYGNFFVSKTEFLINFFGWDREVLFLPEENYENGYKTYYDEYFSYCRIKNRFVKVEFGNGEFS